jgi:hypothetical protein
MEMPWDGTMAAVANVTYMITQPAFCTSDPIAEVWLESSQTSHAVRCSTTQPALVSANND